MKPRQAFKSGAVNYFFKGGAGFTPLPVVEICGVPVPAG